jgi:hypothetical protein
LASQTKDVSNVVASAWANSTEVYTLDGTCATSGGDAEVITVNFTGDAFTIPGGATIDGIVLGFSQARTTDDFFDWGVQGTDGWSAYSGKSAGVGNCANVVASTKGDATELWGKTFTPAHVNSADFQVRCKHVKSGKTDTNYLDYWYVTVYYTESVAAGEWLQGNILPMVKGMEII